MRRAALPSGLQRLTAQLAANARHLHALNPALRSHHDAMIALAHAVERGQRTREQAVLLHGDLHAGNLLLDGNDRLVAIDPSPAIGEPEQDIGDATALGLAAPCEWLYRRTRIRTRGDRHVTALCRTQAPEPHQRPRSRRRPRSSFLEPHPGWTAGDAMKNGFWTNRLDSSFTLAEHGKSTQNQNPSHGAVAMSRPPRGLGQLWGNWS
jgi:hypothetical protein